MSEYLVNPEYLVWTCVSAFLRFSNQVNLPLKPGKSRFIINSGLLYILSFYYIHPSANAANQNAVNIANVDKFAINVFSKEFFIVVDKPPIAQTAGHPPGSSLPPAWQARRLISHPRTRRTQVQR